MLMSVEELRQHVTTTETDQGLALLLQALERVVQGYTNNNFHKYVENGVIVYPADIKLGVINLVKWELNGRKKANVAAETISRHSVTYRDETANTINGYPAHLMGFLKPYMCARFGQWGGY